jgi:hypothetical protein
LEDGGAFIVQSVELGSQTGVDKGFVDGLEGVKDIGRAFGTHGNGMDGVTIVVIEDKNLGVASA